MPCVQDIYKYLDILLFVEATIYQMDEENEALCEALTQGSISGNTQQHTFQGALTPRSGIGHGRALCWALFVGWVTE